MARTHYLTYEQFLPVSREVLVEFFSVPENLSRITPEEISFQVIYASHTRIQQGTQITYRMKQLGIPVKWKAIIAEWTPPDYFVDVQVKGHFAYYRHKHMLIEKEGGTLIRDELEYRLPFSPISDWLVNFWVKKNLKETFEFRSRKMNQLFNQR